MNRVKRVNCVNRVNRVNRVNFMWCGVKWCMLCVMTELIVWQLLEAQPGHNLNGNSSSVVTVALFVFVLVL